MKILIVDYCVDVVGGVERTLCTLANSLEKGNEVTVLSENRFVKESFYEYNKSVRKEYLFNFLGTNNGGMSFAKKLYRKTFLRKKIRDFFIAHNDYDVIIFGRVFVSLHFLPYIRQLFKNKPKVIVRDAIHLYNFKKSEQRQLKRLFPENVDTFVVSSDESKKQYEAFFESNIIKIVKIYNPIGIKPVVGYSPSAKTVVSIGRMDDGQKGFDTLIRAFVEVHKEHCDWRLNLYGNGKEREKLLELIRDLRAEAYVSILNPIKDVVTVFNESSIFVLASRYEGYANILVEALACGIPSVSFNWMMGVDEIIKDRENGIIVRLTDRFKYMKGALSENDCINLARAINNLIDDSKLMNALSKNSVKIIEEHDANMILNRWRKLISD